MNFKSYSALLRKLAPALAIAASLLVSSTSFSGTFTWTASGTNNNWFTNGAGATANFTPSPMAGNNSQLFDDLGQARTSTVQNFNYTSSGINVSGTGGYTVATGTFSNITLTMNDGASIVNSSQTGFFISGNATSQFSTTGTATLNTGANGITIGRKLGGTGGYVKTGSGILSLTSTANGNWNGSIAVNNGSIDLGSQAFGGSITLSGSTQLTNGKNVGGNLTSTSATASLLGNVGGNLTITSGSFNNGSTGTITGSTSLTNAQAVFAAPATFNGAATIVGGTTTSSAGNTFNNNLSVSGSAVTNFGQTNVGGATTINNSASSFGSNSNFTGAASIVGGTTTVSSGTFGNNLSVSGSAVTNFGQTSVSGSTSINNSNSSFGSDSGFGGAVAIVGGTTTVSSGTFGNNLSVSGSAVTNFGQTSVTGATTINDSTSTFGADSTFTAPLTVATSTVSFGAGNTFGAVNIQSGSSNFNSGATFIGVSTISGGNNVFGSSFTANQNMTISGGTNAFGYGSSLNAVTVTGGSTTLSGPIFTDSVTVNGGFIGLDGVNANALPGLAVTGGTANNVGDLGGSGLNQTGGTVNLLNGKSSTGDLNIAGVVNLGGAGTFGTYTAANIGMFTGANVNMDFAANGSSDQFNANGGNVNYGGNLNLNLTTASNLANYQSWDLFTNFTTYSGTFDGVNVTAGLAAQYNVGAFGLAENSTNHWDVQYGPGIWLSDWTTGGQRFIFNQSSGVLTVVPEPSTIVFAGIGAAMLGWHTWTQGRRKARMKLIEEHFRRVGESRGQA